MKNKNVAHLFTAAFLSLLLSFGGISCLVTAFDLKVSLSVLFFCCAACAAGGCLAFSFRRGGAAILCVLALLGGYLWQQGTLYQQSLRLCYNISIIYHRAYGFGWLGSSAAADSVLLPLCVLSGLIALATGGCIYHRRMAPLAVFCSVLPLVLCLVVTDTVPSPLCFFLLLLGLLLLLLTQSVRRRDAAQGVRLTWMLAAPVALSLGLLFAAIPQSDYTGQNRAEEIQDAVLDWVDRLPYMEVSPQGEVRLSLTRQIPDTVNLQSIGPNTQFSNRVMEVTAESSGRIYLRGHDYDTYTGTEWNTSSRSETFSANRILSEISNRLDTSLVCQGQLSICTNGILSVKYIPYYPAPEAYMRNGAVQNSSDLSEYTYTWYALPSDFETSYNEHEQWLRAGDFGYIVDDVFYSSQYITSNYSSLAHYLLLPDETRAWAKAYLAEYFSFDFNETTCTIASKIAEAVRNSAAYDLDTSRMPREQTDFARWFLEESDTGYCVHYATATAVLLRAAGIPSRYVEGYMFNTAAGEAVTVTGKDAHAWVEYYLDGIGWIPLESTGSAASDDEPAIPVMATDQAQTGSEATGSTDALEETTAATGSEGNRTAPTQPQPGGEKAVTVSKVPVITLLVLLVMVVQWPVRLCLRQWDQQTGTANARALKKWHFACRLSKLLHQAPPEPLKELALRAKFSQHTLTNTDLAAFDAYRDASVTALRRDPWWKQVYYRLFRAAY